MKRQVSKIYEKLLLKNGINDVWEQGSKALVPINESQKLKRKEEILKCNHEFVIYDDNIIECVHCGLTNKYTLTEKALNKIDPKHKKYESYETKLFNEFMENNPDIVCFSDEKIKSNHINILYGLAIELVSDKNDNNEIFSIMKDLHNLENYAEKNYISSMEDTIWLLHRYKEKRLFKMSKSIKKLIKKIDI